MNECEIAIRKNSDGEIYYGAGDYKLEIRGKSINIIHKIARKSFSTEYQGYYFTGRLFIYKGVLIVVLPLSSFSMARYADNVFYAFFSFSFMLSKKIFKLLRITYLKAMLRKLIRK